MTFFFDIFCQATHGSSRSQRPLSSYSLFRKTTFPIACTLALTGTVIHHSCPNSLVTLMISDSFRSNISVAHTISRGCARLFQRMFEPRWGNVCVCFKHRISSCKLQAIQPQVSNWFLITQEPGRSSLVPIHPWVFTWIWEMVTDTWGCLVVHSSDHVFSIL